MNKSVFLSLIAVFGFSGIWGASLIAAEPDSLIPVGDSPFALALSPDGQQAVVVNLFPVRNPDGSAGPNIRLVDLNTGTQINAFKLGTRLVSVALAGTTALVVNEDQDVLRLVSVANGQEIGQVKVGSRPSAVIATGPTTAIVANGTSGDLSFINLTTRQVVGQPVPVGRDPRGLALHPDGLYAYVALGGENAIAVLERNNNSGQVVTKIPVGKNPVSVQVAPDGSRAIVANLTSNTVTVLGLENPAQPYVLMNVPVGVQPTAIAIDPVNTNLAYVSNLGSPFISVVDMSTNSSRTALIGITDTESPTSGIQITADGARLVAAEFRNQANLRVYSLDNLQLDPAPTIDVPGEPVLKTFLDATGVCSFYIAEATLVPGQNEGFWGMEVLVSQGQLTGGFNLGGGFEGNGKLPGFGAFSLSVAQTVAINVAAQPLPGSVGDVSLTVILKKDGAEVTRASGPPPLSFNANLTPGFHIVEIISGPDSPRGTFQMGLDAPGFSGGVVVGGFIQGGVTGFGAFCLPQPQDVSVQLLGNSEYLGKAAGDLILTLLDADREVTARVNNSIPAPPPIEPPPPPDVSGLTINLYVDASASPGGSGSSQRPFRSIRQAITAARSGQTIFVRPGRYSPSRTGDSLPMNGFKTGIKLIGAGAANTIIDGENADANAVVIDAANVRMAGFTVRGAGQAGVYIFRSNNVLIENNLFTSNVRFGLGGQESRGLIVRNNVAVSNLESGMAFAGSTPMTIANAPTNCPASPSGAYGAYIINNVATDNRADGILLSQGGNICVADNDTRSNGSSGIEFNNRAENISLPALNGTVIHNTIVGNGGVQFGFAGTGLLVTEDADVAIIQENSLLNNRPFGIGIFLNGEAGVITGNTVLDTSQQGILVQRGSHVDVISNNTIRNSGASALFVENDADVDLITQNISTGSGTGLSILDRSAVANVTGNSFDRNEVAMEVVNSNASTIANNAFTGSSGGGIYIREGSSINDFSNNQVLNSRGLGGMIVDASSITINGGEFSENSGAGIGLYSGATATIRNALIEYNQTPGGVFVTGGSSANLTGVTIGNNVDQGVLAADPGSNVTLSGSTVTGTQGIGLNAQNGATITCSGSNTISGNSGGNTVGSVTGCQ